MSNKKVFVSLNNMLAFLVLKGYHKKELKDMTLKEIANYYLECVMDYNKKHKA